MQALACPTDVIVGDVAFQRYGQPTTQWHPDVAIVLARGEGANAERAVLHITAKQYKPPFSVSMFKGIGDTAVDSVAFEDLVGSDGSVHFLVRWDSKGEVVASVGSEQHSVNLGGWPDTLQINGSTGAGTVVYRLGHYAQSDRTCPPIA